MSLFNFLRCGLSPLIAAALASTSMFAGAQTQAYRNEVPAALVKKASAMVDADAQRLVEIFKDIHQNPELGFMENRTAALVAKELVSLGYDVKTGIGQTGVVGILRNGPGPTLMFRADMDANAVAETTGLPYASKVKVKQASGAEVPVAHLCGHDAHVTWLLSIAKNMAQLKAEWAGTLVLVAQPAEELIQGAKAMVDDGLYTKLGVPKPDYLLGMHTAPFPTGLVAFRPGDTQAGTDQLDVTFHGIGGHGSSPHVAKDPVLMAAAAVVQYQFIISRAIDPQHAAVITVGSIQAGAENNTIPDKALLKINLRWYAEEDRKLMLAGIERINQSIAYAYGLPENLKPTTVLKGGSKVLSNDPQMAKDVQPVLRSLLGEQAVIPELPKVMGSEDFHHLVIDNEKHQYLYMVVGTAKPEHVKKALADGKQVPYSNHNSDYQVDLDAIPIGAKVGTVTALQFLAQGKSK
ncbi:MAG: amidohydrolase [Rhodoferax sp.]|nr:amidohydrolase [Rhodoferax sp.]